MGRAKRYKGYLRKSFTFNGRRQYVYGRTNEELLQNEILKRKELETAEEALYNPMLDDYYAYFTELRRSEIRESSLRCQKGHYGNISGVIMANGRPFGEMRIKDITRRDIEYARQQLLDQGKSPQNLNICFAHLNHVFQCAVIDDTLVKNPCRGLKRLKRDMPPIGENRHRALSIEETRRFFEAAEARNSYYINAFRFMLKTGVRVGELGALERSDIDKINRFIHVRHTLSRNEAGRYIISENPKTASGERSIPLSDEVLSVVRDQEELNCIICGLRWQGALFKSPDGGFLKEYTLNREIGRICSEAGIEYFTCHCFRNTFATRFMEQRPNDFKILSEIMGHKNTDITLNLYTHVMAENKVRAMNALVI